MKRRKFVNEIGKGLTALSLFGVIPVDGKSAIRKQANMSTLVAEDFKSLLGETSIKLTGNNGQIFKASLDEIIIGTKSSRFREPFVQLWTVKGDFLPEEGIYSYELPSHGLVHAYFNIKSDMLAPVQRLDSSWN